MYAPISKIGAIVEWSKTLGYGEESHRKSSDGREIETGELCQPSNIFFDSEKDNAERKKKDGLRLPSVCPRYSEPLSLTASTAIRLWEVFTFLYHFRKYRLL